MHIRMVGTGSAFAKKYDNNNALIETNGFRLLVDCGITLPKALHQMGLSFPEIDAVLISHIHGDHVGGLEEFAFQMMFKYSRKPVLFIAETLIEPLWEHTLRGGLTQEPLNKLDDFFDVRPLEANKEIELHPGLIIELVQTKHILNKPSYSFLFNRRFFYSADMRFDGGLLRKLVDQGVSTIYHDCQLESPGVVHASLEELLTLPEDIQRKTWLMHYGDAIEQYEGRTGHMRIVEQYASYEV
ncbi:MBL fold metallo-hydrolase [Paenibacillus prosopidis]|uniref:Ribonuclease BN (tRNA processing enzyme) n=1 Tax=Paenibacillus prosopidis TaxID=630520 RepID=A0A368VWR5_9BACL|nr:MBL fold metallo-hydrolase [Paenibacillus prosopidis]RCW46601.1 ribonuclease BN (tRNA processing enzyme) [Paenibacillus prosopidis]